MAFGIRGASHSFVKGLDITGSECFGTCGNSSTIEVATSLQGGFLMAA